MTVESANDAFNLIAQKLDELYIQAETQLIHMRKALESNDSSATSSASWSSADRPVRCQSSTRFIPPTSPDIDSLLRRKPPGSPSTSSKKAKKHAKKKSKYRVKTKSYRACKKNKALVIVSMNSEQPMVEHEIEQVEKKIQKLLEEDESSTLVL